MTCKVLECKAGQVEADVAAFLATVPDAQNVSIATTSWDASQHKLTILVIIIYSNE